MLTKTVNTGNFFRSDRPITDLALHSRFATQKTVGLKKSFRIVINNQVMTQTYGMALYFNYHCTDRSDLVLYYNAILYNVLHFKSHCNDRLPVSTVSCYFSTTTALTGPQKARCRAPFI